MVEPEPQEPVQDPPGRAGWVVRRLLPFALVTGVLALVVRSAAAPLSNYDTYFHLRLGHEFATGAWSVRDPGSVTGFATADWVPTQWLPQVVMARTEDWFGLAGVAWLAGLLFVTLAVTFYVVARRRADPLVVAPLVILALGACTAGLSMRPQVISYVLVAVTVSAWLRALETHRTPWFLVPLTWLWAMCHGMWPVGIVIGAVVVVGALLDRRADAGLRMAAVPVLSALAACATPVGPELVRAVVLVSSRGDYFTEWGPPDFTQADTLALLALLAVTTVILVRRSGSTWVEVLLVGLAAAWAVYSVRTVPVAAAMLVPLAAVRVQQLVGPRSPSTALERRCVAGAAVAALAVLAVQVPHTSDEPLAQPAWVDQELSALPAGTPVLTDVGYGGYVMWRFPQLELVGHGYGDMFTDAELDRVVTISALRPGWVDVVKDTGVRHAVLDPDTALAYALRDLAGWRVVEDSPDLQLLEPPPDWDSSPVTGGE